MFSRDSAISSVAALAFALSHVEPAPTPPAFGVRNPHKKIASRYDGARIRELAAQRGCGVAFMKARKRAERLATAV